MLLKPAHVSFVSRVWFRKLFVENLSRFSSLSYIAVATGNKGGVSLPDVNLEDKFKLPILYLSLLPL